MNVQLNKSYKYICIDLETSWLDKDTDHIIQIGIIALDEKANFSDNFSSYINPWEEHSKLNDTVAHLTNISSEDLLNAPSIEEAKEQIVKYFGDDVILIWHNISFDEEFLKKHMPSLSWHSTIDTFDISASSIPYLKSYALENIHAHLLQQENYTNIYTHNKEAILWKWKEWQSHNALYDSLLCLCIIKRWLHHISILREKYPYVGLSYTKVDKEMWYISITQENINKDISIEAIQRPLALKEKKNTHQSLEKEFLQWESNKISMKNLNIKELIDTLPKPSLIAVSHPSKIDIIKNAYPDYHFNYLKDDQLIDFTIFNKRIQKDYLSMDEWLFVVLYASHALLWYSVLQTHLPIHKHILSYISDKNITKNYMNHILCTHGGWYSYREQNPDRSNKLDQYTICMLDIDRRYITYNDYASKHINLQSLLFPRDEFLYHKRNDNILFSDKYKDISEYEKVYGDLLIFLGLFYIESDNIHKHKKRQQREVSCYDSPHYERSMIVRKWIYNTWQLIASEDDKESYLSKRMEKINKLFLQESKIQYTQSSGKEWYYTITPSQRYIDFSEYNDLFEQHKYYFFSPHRWEYKIVSPVQKQWTPIDIKNIHTLQLLDQEILNSSEKNIFIISHNSERSKQIFSHIRTQEYIKNKEILAEHITGGIQKNVAKSNRIDQKSLIMIGGYHYLLNTWWSKVSIDKVVIYHIPKSREPFIHDDIARYAPA